MKKGKVNLIAYLGSLVALEIILSRFLSFNAWNIKIGFNFVPIVVAALLFGPMPAGIVAAMGDFLGAILFPIGAYFPGFTAIAFLTGIVFGVFLYKKQSAARTFCAVVINQLVFSFLLNSLWISILYGSPYLPLLATRIIQCAVLGPVQFITITFIIQGLVTRMKYFIAQDR